MSDILVDTSAWIEFFRSGDSAYANVVDLLLGEDRVCTTGLVIVEVLSGFRTKAEFKKLERGLTALPYVSEAEAVWKDLLDYRLKLKEQGINGASIPDLILVNVALKHQKAILTCDQDFKRMQPVLGFDLVSI